MDFWHKARRFAEEAGKRSLELTKDAAKRSQELSIGSSKLSDIVSETAKRSKEIATEASKRAEQIRSDAIKRADQIKYLVEGMDRTSGWCTQEQSNLEKFGVSDELREFVKEIHISTFQEFPLADDSPISDVPAVSNVRQDLTEWQEKHANLVLSTVKEISKLRYVLCPRIMKERKFWRIYFILVNSHVAPYEKRYMEEIKLNSSEKVKDDKEQGPSEGKITHETVMKVSYGKNKMANLSSKEQDSDVFLLGGDSDEERDDINGSLDDEFDKMIDGWVSKSISFPLFHPSLQACYLY